MVPLIEMLRYDFYVCVPYPLSNVLYVTQKLIYREIDLKGEQGPAVKFLLAQMLAFPHAGRNGKIARRR
jgi:hypothetical protein